MALQHGIEYCQSRDFIVDDLPGNNATRTKVLNSLENSDPIWFFGVGHGNRSIFTGQNLGHIFWVCDCKELRGRVVFLLSCLVGAELGPDMVNDKGATTFIGYKEVFSWLQEEFQDPLEDPYGKSFFEPVLEIIYRLADGYTTREAYNASMAKWNYWIDYWTKSDDPYAPAVLQLLIHDRNAQVLIGSEEARVTRTVPEIPWWLVATLTAPAAYLAVSLLTKPRCHTGGHGAKPSNPQNLKIQKFHSAVQHLLDAQSIQIDASKHTMSGGGSRQEEHGDSEFQ